MALLKCCGNCGTAVPGPARSWSPGSGRFRRAVAIRHTVVDVVDRDVDDAVARSFLTSLPAELAGRLRAEGERADYPAGTTVYRAGDDPWAALVVRGLIRVYLSSPGGRQVTVRYARPGDVLGDRKSTRLNSSHSQ